MVHGAHSGGAMHELIGPLLLYSSLVCVCVCVCVCARSTSSGTLDLILVERVLFLVGLLYFVLIWRHLKQYVFPPANKWFEGRVWGARALCLTRPSPPEVLVLYVNLVVYFTSLNVRPDINWLNTYLTQENKITNISTTTKWETTYWSQILEGAPVQ